MNFKNEARNGECLDEDLISGYLEGVLTPVVKTACEDHLIVCDGCRERLAAFMRLLRTESGAEEEAEIDAALARWDRESVRSIPPAQQTPSWKRIGLAGGGFAAAALLVGLFFWLQPSGNIVEDWLKTNRPTHARLSDQQFLPLNITRGPGDNARYDLLLEEMRETGADAYTLGRFYLILHRYDDAVRQLRTAADAPNASAEIRNDLGVGYFERENDGDSERALQEFQAALALDEEFLPAVFNLCLLYEREGKTAEAQEQWRRYLELDPDSAWAGEISVPFSRKEPGQ